MSEKLPLDRGIIVLELALNASEITESTFRDRGDRLPPSIAMARSFLKVGREYLVAGLARLDDTNLATRLEDHFAQMNSRQGTEFSIGFSLGLIGCAALEVNGVDYFANYANFISGTSVPPEPTNNYRIAEEKLRRSYPSLFDPRLEEARLRSLIEEDPTLSKILSDTDKLPAIVLAHLNSMHPSVMDLFEKSTPIWTDATAALQKLPIGNIVPNPIALNENDDAWLKDLFEKF